MLRKILMNKRFMKITFIILCVISAISWGLLAVIETFDWNPFGNTTKKQTIQRGDNEKR